MELTSTAFSYNESIPAKYTCDAENINPPLSFTGVPIEAKSLALLMWDPDVPRTIRSDGNWDHWVVYNMPAGTLGISEGAKEPGLVGLNSRGELKYGGPGPPDGEHRYFFKLFALDSQLSFESEPTRQGVLEAMNNHVIVEAELMGRYTRQK